MDKLKVYKAKEMAKFTFFCFLLCGVGHFFWTIFCGLANLNRGY